jgi:tetratricopeptide (TPR) repeat protein
MQLINYLHWKIFLIFFLVILFLFSQEVRAENQSESSAFQDGVTAFKQGNYESALHFFHQAESLGFEKPSLYYNIGVSCYKLGRYQEAEEAFRKTATFPQMAPLAYYNLGVVAEKQSDHKKALYWLQKSYDNAEADDVNLRVLAANALGQIKDKTDSSAWASYVSAGLGYDDNVELVSDSDVLQTSNMDDLFLDMYLFTRRSFAGDSSASGSYFQSSIFYLKYAEVNEYDTGSADLALFYWKQAGSYQLEGGGGYYYTIIDGQSYEQSPMISLQAKRSLWASTYFRLRYRLNYLDVLDSDYDYLTGWRHRTMAELSRSWGKSFGYLAYTLELNDRDDEDYSPTRHLFAAGLDVKPLDNVGVNLYVAYRASHYDIASFDDRNEGRFDSSLNLTYFLVNGWEISCKLEHTHSESNDDLYDYKRNAVTLFFARSF